MAFQPSSATAVTEALPVCDELIDVLQVFLEVHLGKIGETLPIVFLVRNGTGRALRTNSLTVL